MKKNLLIRMLIIVMMLALVMGTLAGCGGEGNETKDEPKTQTGDNGTTTPTDPTPTDPTPVVKTDAELILGQWEANIDLNDAFQQAMEESDGGEMFADIDFSGITMRMTAEFKDDTTMNLKMDKDSAKAAMDLYVDRIVEALPEIMRKAIAEQAGVDVSEVTDDMLDMVLQSMGTDSWEAFGDLIRDSMDVDSMFDNTEFSGHYMVKDGKLYTEESSEATEDSQSMRYELNGDKLVLHTEDASSEMPEFMSNLTFTRIG